jgi:HNH endonuclease.
MSSVCGLCGEYKEGILTAEYSSMPDFPARVAGDGWALVCTSCSLDITNAADGVCGHCGDGGAIRLVEQNTRGVPEVGYLCAECFTIAQGEYPSDFSQKLRHDIRESQGYKCADCGMPQEAHKEEFGQKLHVHHKDGDKRNNSEDNLVALCARCHGSK